MSKLGRRLIKAAREGRAMTFTEVMKSDLVKEHGIERALWIVVNAHRRCSALAEFRKKRIEQLEAVLNVYIG